MKVVLKKKKHRKESRENNTELEDIYKFTVRFSEKIIEEELQREKSIIQQSSNMQSSFSFVIAAVFMAASIIAENRGELSLEFLLVAFSTISFALLSSLFCATKAQQRASALKYPSVADLKEQIEDKSFYDKIKTVSQKEAYLLDNYELKHNELMKKNRRNVRWVVRSMWSFYIALGLCAFWFAVSCILIIF